MPSRKLLASVLQGFLETYVSRNSDLDGYLVFGLATDSLDRLEVDLTREEPPTSLNPVSELRRLAIRRFAEQLGKVGLSLSVVHGAILTVEQGPAGQRRLGGGPPGHDYTHCKGGD